MPNEYLKKKKINKKEGTYKKIRKKSLSAMHIHESQQIQIHQDSSSSSLQSQSPCSCLLEFPIQFPKRGMNLSRLRKEKRQSFLPWTEQAVENGENVVDQKQIGPIPFWFKPKQPSLNRHEPATQPITIKPRLKFNPTHAKPTTKIYLELYFS